MSVLIQTAPAGTDFDGTPTRGFIDLAGAQGVDGVNAGRRFVISYLSVNCPTGGTITGVRIALALNKAAADGEECFTFLAQA